MQWKRGEGGSEGGEEGTRERGEEGRREGGEEGRREGREEGRRERGKRKLCYSCNYKLITHMYMYVYLQHGVAHFSVHLQVAD